MDLVAKENNLFKVMARYEGLTFQTQTSEDQKGQAVEKWASLVAQW